MNALTIFNLFLAWVMLFWAKTDFENGNNKLGWLNIFFSAWNIAAAANVIF